ncbi:Twinkle protein [Actinidia chinensis var. chinensis]|uniref:Twinkle protein n=1 Tax=Actinidia chinensis var. chinensis TaxID=1590841 RepID=A0A2R6Q5R6_ACTCC|nr:Twinkle protein [Actinidia chinensis var. chinensis]
MLTAKATIPISNCSQFHQFRSHPHLSSISSPKPTSRFRPFSLYTSDSHSFLHAGIPVNVGYNDEQKTSDTSELRILMQKVEGLGINSDSCTPGRYNLMICPQCKGGQPMEKSLSFHISENGDLAMWRCFRVECGWAGQAFEDKTPMYNGFSKISKVNCPGLITLESLGLVPLGEKLIAYFLERMISNNTLQRNSVMQISGDQNVIAFTYIRNGSLVTCKYRSLEKKYRQEKGTEKILYGLDDIEEADEIIIVEGEIDKLSMEEAGFLNCVSVPDGAPQKLSTKELPSPEKDYTFQYLWNCKEYLDKASRIILATDGDKPGAALAEELARRLGRERCWQVSWPKKDEFSCFKDANEVLKNLGSGALRDVVENAKLLDANAI